MSRTANESTGRIPPPIMKRKILSEMDISDLTGYADGEYRIRVRLKISQSELHDLALDAGVEKCNNCGWWDETHSMIPHDTDEPDGKCDNCRINKD